MREHIDIKKGEPSVLSWGMRRKQEGAKGLNELLLEKKPICSIMEKLYGVCLV
jgi:hypothetical protein